MRSRSFGRTAVPALLLSLASGVAMPQTPAAELAITRTAAAADLQWGACPAGFPEGCGIAVLHGDPAQPNADVFFRVPAKAVIPEHWHTSAERMVLVSGELQLAYAGQKPAVLKPGAYAYGPARARHSARCADAGPCVLFIAFESAVDVQGMNGPPK